MHVAKLQIDRLGEWNKVTLGPLEPGLNVVCGLAEADRAALAPFIQTLLFGGQDRECPLQSASPLYGSLTIWGPQGLLTVHRHEQGAPHDRWMVETEEGSMLSPRRLEQLLGTANAELFDRVFVLDFHRPQALDVLFQAARSQGLSLVGGHGDAARLEPLRQRLGQYRARLESCPGTESSLAVLLERHRHVRTEVEALAAAGRQYHEQQAQQRAALQSRLVACQQQQEQAEAEEARLAGEIARRQSERQLQEQQLSEVRFEQQRTVIQQRERLEEIESQLQRWRLVLRDVESRRAALRAETEGEAESEQASWDPGDCLHQIQSGVQELRETVGQWPGTRGGELWPERVGSEASYSESMVETQGVLDQLARLQTQLHAWQAAVRQTESWHRGGQLKRCARELRTAIRNLARERQQLRDDLVHRQRSWGLPGEGNGVPAERHSVAFDEGDPIVLGEEMLAVLDAELQRLEQQQGEFRQRIERGEDELRQVRQELELAEPGDEANPHGARFETKQRELERLEQQIRDSRQRQELAAQVEELECEVRHLEAATAETTILRQAATFLRIFSAQRLERILITPERTVRAVDQRGSRLTWDQLEAGQQDQVRLALHLAVVAALAEQGHRLPLILHDVFLRQSPARWAPLANVLRDLARSGQQILLVLGSPAAVDFFRSRQVAIHRWPSARLPISHRSRNGRCHADEPWEINQQLNAIAQETSGGLFHEVPALNAEEFPGELTDRVRRPPAGEAVDRGQPAELESKDYFLTERALIHEAPSIDAATAERFRKIGVATVGDLLRLSVSEGAQRLRHAGITDRMIRRWQREALLVCRIARLRPYDARILVACGIETPEQLARLDARQLRRRVEAFAETRVGQVLMQAGHPSEMLRLTRWIQAAQRAPGLRAA